MSLHSCDKDSCGKVQDVGKLWRSEQLDYLYNNEIFSDVTFLVGSGTGGSSNIKKVCAIKSILATHSAVFRSMFFGPLSEKASTISIPNVHPKVFNLFMEFIYTGGLRNEKDLPLNQAVKLLQVADQYDVKGLITMCGQNIKTRIKNDNVCYFLKKMKGVFQDIYEHCLSHFVDNILLIMHWKEKEVYDLEEEILLDIVKHPALEIKEDLLIQLLIKWASENPDEVDLKNLEANPPRPLKKSLLTFVPHLKLGLIQPSVLFHFIKPWANLPEEKYLKALEFNTVYTGAQKRKLEDEDPDWFKPRKKQNSQNSNKPVIDLVNDESNTEEDYNSDYPYFETHEGLVDDFGGYYDDEFDTTFDYDEEEEDLTETTMESTSNDTANTSDASSETSSSSSSSDGRDSTDGAPTID